MKKALLFTLISLHIFATINAAGFKKGDICKIIGGPLLEQDKSVTINGSCLDIWNIKDLKEICETKPHFLCNGAILQLISSYCMLSNKEPIAEILREPKKILTYIDSKYHGIFYYGKVGSLGYCFHPSWLELIEEENN